MIRTDSRHFRGLCQNRLQRRAGSAPEIAALDAAQVNDAIGSLVDAGVAMTVDGDDTSRLLVLGSGEIFRLNDVSITRIL